MWNCELTCFRVQGLGYSVQCLWCRIESEGSDAQTFGAMRSQSLGCRVEYLLCRVQCDGFKCSDVCCDAELLN